MIAVNSTVPKAQLPRVHAWVAAFQLASFRTIHVVDGGMMVLYGAHENFDLQINWWLEPTLVLTKLTTNVRDAKNRLYSTCCTGFSLDYGCIYRPFVPVIARAFFCLGAKPKFLRESYGFAPTKEEKASYQAQFRSALRSLTGGNQC